MQTLTRIVAVIGASYGGNHASQMLAQGLPKDWRVFLVDRNTHINHLYTMPRFATIPEEGYKAFIPYTNIFDVGAEDPKDMAPHYFLNAHVTSLSNNSLTLDRAFPEHGIDGDTPTLHFDYLIYALGAHLPGPIDLWGPVDPQEKPGQYPKHDGSKKSALNWLQRFKDRNEKANSILVVGGGALGIQYSTDFANMWPNKTVTLLHSRERLLPRFDEGMHDEIMKSMSEFNITTILGERLNTTLPPKIITLPDGTEERVVQTESGREIHASVVLMCTGQKPNTEMIAQISPDCIVPDGPSRGAAVVNRHMQLSRVVPKKASFEAPLEKTLASLSVSDSPQEVLAGEAKDQAGEAEDPYKDDPEFEVAVPNIFVIGDSADAFGAINAGHTAYWQGEVAARNILRLAKQGDKEGEVELEKYAPGAPAIKVSLGFSEGLYQVNGVIGRKTDCPRDLDAPLMWKFSGMDVSDEEMKRL